ncbi:hypothetical protein HMPREF6123_1825 [Oribacterium sinus F0268]|uniref:Uncharacterized protein n=1 Tax=Oribacterium sinus F0268 TaxID=585501 RepID=C2KZA6_9FIRM|nr:hypothetical protein HMPREF6123_1825 [Oribacterium sinus F0268]
MKKGREEISLPFFNYCRKEREGQTLSFGLGFALYRNTFDILQC